MAGYDGNIEKKMSEIIKIQNLLIPTNINEDNNYTNNNCTSIIKYNQTQK